MLQNWSVWVPTSLLLLTTTPVLAQPATSCTPREIHATHTNPDNPLWSTNMGSQAWTVLRVTVGPDGVPNAMAVDQRSGTPSLDETALAHVQKFWRWQPQTDPACMHSQTIMVSIDWSQQDQK